jgi:hypothetical protein
MKTEDLIVMLSSGPDLHVATPPTRATVLPLLYGVLASLLLMLATLGVRHDLLLAALLPAFWLKLQFAAALAWAGGLAAARLAKPGSSTAMLPVYLGLPLLLLWAVAGVMLWRATPEQAAALFWGSTWRVCPLLIGLLSLPIFVAAIRIMRAWAPTRLRLAGAAAGFAAGAIAAVVYCLHCPEMSGVFVGVWYLLGMLLPAALGALIGPRALAW